MFAKTLDIDEPAIGLPAPARCEQSKGTNVVATTCRGTYGHDTNLPWLVSQIEAGVRSAEAELVRRFHRGLTVLTRRHCRPNEARVPDVVQTVLMETIGRLRKGALRDADALPAYLRRSVVREVAELYSCNGKPVDFSSTRAEVAEPSVRDTPESVAERSQMVRTVLETIDSLSVPRDREVLIRFFVREESRDEICAALGVKVSHFRRILFRARERLQDLMRSAGCQCDAEP